ncbi:MAG: bifunctional sulfate adenylyltransferase/adenylylsulfate kinase [Thermoanaerobaculia bacterium]|nr:bifunctional sulfate adenylyltransferase/adenylylsulfate kinase [Thermoanaerobaculia bacterium]
MTAPLTLPSPYGGELVDLRVAPELRDETLSRARHLPVLPLSERSLCDLELLATGGFSPLRGFLGREDYARVLDEMRLTDGTLWPIPVTLPVPAGAKVALDADVALTGPKGEILAVLAVRELYPWRREAEAKALLGSFDEAHPLVAEAASWGPVFAAGELTVIDLPARFDFTRHRLEPSAVRARLADLGNPRVVAFQTRNPLHRSHEELLRRAQDALGATLLLHPSVGMTRPGDVDHVTRVRTYEAVVSRHLDASRCLLALLPLAMRMAGPREALWHALIRRNHGASHFIVGRDHAGPGPRSDGKPFFGPFEAQELVERHAAEIGVEMVRFGELVYLPDHDRYEEAASVPPGTRTLGLSGTAVRDMLARGEELPVWFTRPEVARLLAEANPPRHRQGFCVWLTGLSGSGKSTTAEALAARLAEQGRPVTVLDGDVVRTHLSKGLGFSREDRDTNILRIGYVAAEVVRHGGVAICAAISPYRATRDRCREMVGADRFLEVFQDTPLEVCEGRDTKGLYAKARAGLVKGVTGIDDPYEAPLAPEVSLGTATGPVENADLVVAALERRGFIRG